MWSVCPTTCTGDVDSCSTDAPIYCNDLDSDFNY